MSFGNSHRCNQVSEVDEELAIMATAINHLKRHLLWPKAGENRLKYCVKATVITLCYASVGACCAGYIYDVKNRGVDVGYEGDLAASVASFSQSLIILWFIFKQTSISNILKEMVTFDDFGKPIGFENTEYKLKLISNVMYVGAVCGLTTYGFVPFFEISRCEEYNRLHDINEVCGLYAPISSILHIDGLPMTYIYFAYQATATYCVMPALAVIPVLAYGIHEHIATRIEHLKEKLRLCNEQEITRKGILREFIREHQHIIRLANKADDITAVPLCVHVFLTSTVITLILHQILTPSWRTPGGPIMHMLIWLIIIFMNSVGGQRVKDESLNVADEIYNYVKWYDMDIMNQKDLHIVMCRAQKALVVKTGAFGYMDLTLLLTVIKGLYTFCIASLCRPYLN